MDNKSEDDCQKRMDREDKAGTTDHRAILLLMSHLAAVSVTEVG